MPFNVALNSLGTQLTYTGSITGGALTLRIDAVADVGTGAVLTFTESMTDSAHGDLFTRVHSTRHGVIAMRYDFGAAVDGAKSLVLMAEKCRTATFVSGVVDEGRTLYPVRFPVGGCACPEPAEGILPAMVGSPVAVGDASAAQPAPLNIRFPDDYIANLKLLVVSLKAAVDSQRFASQNIALGASTACFWGNLACEVAAKACIIGCGGFPPCIIACLIAEAACLAALLESHGDLA